MQKICVRMPNWLGDAVMGTPVLHDIKKAYPDCSLTVICHNAIKILLEATPFIDNFIVFANDKKRSAQEKKRIYNELQQGQFDAGILLTRSLSSAWWFYKGKIARRIGFKDHYRTLLLTDALDIPENEETEHQVITYKRLLEPLGIPMSTSAPQLYLTPEEIQTAKDHLKSMGVESHHLLIGINPGAAFGSAKCWLPERFKELTARLSLHPDVRIVYFGDATTKPLVDDITSRFGNNVLNFAGKTTLRSFTTLLSLCNCLVTNDSGPMHVAAALGTPLVAIFGSTNEVKTGPYGGGTIIHKHTLCSPCYKRVCPIDFRCMTSISVDDVHNAILHTVGHDARLSR
ncbi:MAG: lipopolysaccharide heptosyltransferase II [Chlamydiales bacterium]|nr:lipopolysaccharide heptosyltransferase II [Chlamydiales bacterium]